MSDAWPVVDAELRQLRRERDDAVTQANDLREALSIAQAQLATALDVVEGARRANRLPEIGETCVAIPEDDWRRLSQAVAAFDNTGE